MGWKKHNKPKTSAQIVAAVNRLFPRDCGHPACFIRTCEIHPVVSAEPCCGRHENVADYWGEWHEGFPWISPKLENYLSQVGWFAEWENPGALILYPL